jgi:hypothetical protein
MVIKQKGRIGTGNLTVKLSHMAFGIFEVTLIYFMNYVIHGIFSMCFIHKYI